MVDEVVLNPETRATVPVNSMMKFTTQKINFKDEFGQEWLKTGYVTLDFASYPDAAVNEGISFNAITGSGTIGEFKWAYSPTLKRWAGVNSYDGSSGAPTSSTKRTLYSSDDFATVQSGAIEDIICRALIWSDYHQKFIGSGSIGTTPVYYFIESADGITWTRVASAFAGLSLAIDEITGRLISESAGNSRVPYYGSSITGPFVSTGLPASTTVVFSDPDFGVYCNSGGTLRRSTDGGATWQVVTIDPDAQVSASTTLSFAALNGVLYVTNYTNSLGYVSTDGINLIPEPQLGTTGYFRVYDGELIAVGKAFVNKYPKIGEVVSLSTATLVASGGTISDAIIGGNVLLVVGSRSSGYFGVLYDTWVGNKTPSLDEFVRIK